MRGYKEALKEKPDYIVEMDSGFSHLPSELHLFTENITEGFDCVFGIRPLWSLSYKAPLARRVYSLGGTILANFLLGTRLKDMTSGYEAFSYKAASKIFSEPFFSTGHFFQTEVRYRAKKMRYKEIYIQYNFPTPRMSSKSLLNSFYTLWHLSTSRLKRK